eukprot:COSAG02_NODE_53232_length_303_cov_0.745098_1_plen_46_part_10
MQRCLSRLCASGQGNTAGCSEVVQVTVKCARCVEAQQCAEVFASAV